MRPDYFFLTSLAILFTVLLLGSSAYRNGKKQHNEVQNDSGHVKPSKPANRWSTYSRLYHYLLKREKPWMLLPDSNNCYQNWCDSNSDCCRGFNICDKSVKVCIDCWYGYHCRTSADCCERYPACNKKPDEEYGRCTDEAN